MPGASAWARGTPSYEPPPVVRNGYRAGITPWRSRPVGGAGSDDPTYESVHDARHEPIDRPPRPVTHHLSGADPGVGGQALEILDVAGRRQQHPFAIGRIAVLRLPQFRQDLRLALLRERGQRPRASQAVGASKSYGSRPKRRPICSITPRRSCACPVWCSQTWPSSWISVAS